MMIARKIRKLYPLLNVLKLVKIAKPLGASRSHVLHNTNEMAC
jgi:hypothetical protein